MPDNLVGGLPWPALAGLCKTYESLQNAMKKSRVPQTLGFDVQDGSLEASSQICLGSSLSGFGRSMKSAQTPTEYNEKVQSSRKP